MRIYRNQCRLMTTVLTAVALSTLTLVCSTTHANDFTKRFYLNGGLGITQVEPESPSDALTISDNTDAGAHIALGYDLSRFVALEAYAATLGTAEVEFLGASAGSVDYTVYGLSALGYLYNSRSGVVFGDEDTSGLFRREGLSLYGRLGVGHMQNDAERVTYKREHANHLAFGLGLEYGFSNGFALRTQWMGLDTDAQYLSVGLLKRFGDVAAVTALGAALPPVTKKNIPLAEPEPVAPTVFKPVVAPYVYFAFDESELSPESTQKLDEFATQVIDRDLDLTIEGHTDWIAPEAYNMSLSVRRAEAVANYLESKGIARERITTMGYGESRPISDNDTEDGRALNRRSEIVMQ